MIFNTAHRLLHLSHAMSCHVTHKQKRGNEAQLAKNKRKCEHLKEEIDHIKVGVTFQLYTMKKYIC